MERPSDRRYTKDGRERVDTNTRWVRRTKRNGEVFVIR
jgi:hypothetical protein